MFDVVVDALHAVYLFVRGRRGGSETRTVVRAWARERGCELLDLTRIEPDAQVRRLFHPTKRAGTSYHYYRLRVRDFLDATHDGFARVYYRSDVVGLDDQPLDLCWQDTVPAQLP